MFTAAELYGASPSLGTGAYSTAPVVRAADDMGSGLATLVNPRNPLMWFGVVLAVTLGAAGAAGSVRLGRARVAGSVGKA